MQEIDSFELPNGTIVVLGSNGLLWEVFKHIPDTEAETLVYRGTDEKQARWEFEQCKP